MKQLLRVKRVPVTVVQTCGRRWQLAWWGVCAVKDETFFSVIGGMSDKELRHLMGLKSVVVLKCMIQL